MKLKKFLFYYWKSILVISVILYLSFAPPSEFKGVPTFENEDKLVHILMYGGLTCMLMFDLRQYTKNKPLSALTFMLISLLSPVILGGIVEILQPMYFAPRTAEWPDWFSDITGALLGWIIVKRILFKMFNIK